MCKVNGLFEMHHLNHFYIVEFRVNDCKASKESSNQVHSLAALALEEGM